MITTTDNPYNPYVDFPNWYIWDTTNGYNTCQLVARLYGQFDTPQNVLPAEEAVLLRAIEDEIIDINITGRYVRAIDPNPDPEDEGLTFITVEPTLP